MIGVASWLADALVVEGSGDEDVELSEVLDFVLVFVKVEFVIIASSPGGGSSVVVTIIKSRKYSSPAFVMVMVCGPSVNSSEVKSSCLSCLFLAVSWNKTGGLSSTW